MKDDTYSMEVMKSFGYELYDVTEYGVIFKDNDVDNSLCDHLLLFKDWSKVREWCEKNSDIKGL